MPDGETRHAETKLADLGWASGDLPFTITRGASTHSPFVSWTGLECVKTSPVRLSYRPQT